MFKIGDKVYHAGTHWGQSSVICPDCGGTLKLHVRLFDGTEYDIACAGCAAGYQPPAGRIHAYEYTPSVTMFTVDGIEHDRESVKYKHGGGGAYTIYSAENCFATEQQAETRAAELTEQAKQHQARQVKEKEKDTRSWAWHVLASER